MDLGAWLRRLGLEQYEAAFHDNAVDDAVLPSLTAEDLKELGVASVGHRRKILDAIGALGIEADSKSMAGALPATARAESDAAERRQVTVMFVDLVGSTELSVRMDPEDLREIISAYQQSVTATVRRFEGFVARYMGDGVLVYFGYPRAHEDDAERAVRAGLELIAAVSRVTAAVPLQVRIGIATGLVVVGDLVGSGEARERRIVGETPNLAARLQSIAAANTVVIADSTRRLLGSLFEVEDLGAHDLKGIAAPTKAWVVLRAGSVESRFEALHAAGLTALVGREEECELLLRRWSRATAGEGQVVLLSGEPGIGKSRLIAALMERLAGEPHALLRYFCSPQHTDSALYPIIGQLERAANWAPDDRVEAKLDKLDAVLAQTATTAADAALLAELLSLPSDGRYPALDLAPEQRRHRTLEALLARLQALSGRDPVLMIFEDAHWADPTSVELIGRMVDRIVALPVLLIVTFRPEFEAPWIGLPHVTALTLNRLSQREAEALIDGVIGKGALPAILRHDIVERTDGIPLFVEEMAKAVLEAGSEGEARRSVVAVPSPGLAVPASLYASLVARLDRLGAAKEVAQTGAAIGREFSYALLAAVVGESAPELPAALDRLVAAGLLFRQGVPPHATYLFKHALVQDAAYGMMLREPRRALHARIAAVLESDFPEIVDNRPELLARHCTEAGLIEKAIEYWGRAGRRSLDRSAHAEAVEQLTRALDLIAGLPATRALRRRRIELQVAIIVPLMLVKGLVAPETKTAVQRAHLFIEQAEAVGEPPDDPLLQFTVLYSFWVERWTNIDGDAMRELAAQFLALAEQREATILRTAGRLMVGVSLLTTGELVDGRAHLDRAMALYNPDEHRRFALRFGVDTAVLLLSNRSIALWLLGYPDAAQADAEHALRHAREIGQAATVMYALYYGATTNTLRGNYAAATAELKELSALAEKTDAPYWQTGSILMRGAFHAGGGDAARGVAMLGSAIAVRRTAGETTGLPSFLSVLARAHAKLGQFAEARRCLDEALALVERTKERWFEAEFHRVAGEIARLAPGQDRAEAEACFHRALDIARARRAKSHELRAAMSMARLWRDQGKRGPARELLGPVYAWFKEGFDTLDLREGRALLDDLAR